MLLKWANQKKDEVDGVRSTPENVQKYIQHPEITGWFLVKLMIAPPVP
jgi:hypothetical protein